MTGTQESVSGSGRWGDRTRASFWPVLVAVAGSLIWPLSDAAPLEVYGRLPNLEDVSLSPDGSRIAFVRTSQDYRVLAVKSLSDNKMIGGVRFGEEKLRRVWWADNNRLLLETSVTGMPFGFIGIDREWFLLSVYDIARNKVRQVPDIRSDGNNPRTLNAIIGSVMIRTIKGHTVLYFPGYYVTTRTEPGLFRADLDSGAQSVVRQGGEDTQGWLVDDAGEVIAEEHYADPKQRWWLKIRRDGRMQDALSGQEALEFPSVLGFGPTADTLLMQSLENGAPVWRLLSLKDGTLGEPMAERKSLNSPLEDWQTHRMIGGVHVDDGPHYVFFDPAMQRRWDAIVRAFPGERVQLVSYSGDFTKLIVLVEGARDGYAYELVDMKTHRADPLGEVYDGLTQPLDVQSISYPAADGLEIPAYLTLPRERAAKSLPLVVMPHGGPAVRETAGFDWWAQALADQGYAVLQPNYRGSDLSRQFLEAGFGQWGRKMQTDLSDGVRYLVKQGIVDPARVCIIGGSYGGYAALAGVTLDPGVYRCAVSVAGLSDLKRMLDWVNEKHQSGKNWEQRYWDRFMGVSGPRDPLLETISPIKHLGALNAPVLLIHGKDDTVVPFEQSSVMFDELRRAKKEVELVTLKREDHWLSRSETRLQMLQASIAFLRAHNPPDPPSPAAAGAAPAGPGATAPGATGSAPAGGVPAGSATSAPAGSGTTGVAPGGAATSGAAPAGAGLYLGLRNLRMN